MTSFDALLNSNPLNGYGNYSQNASFYNPGEEIYTGFLNSNNFSTSVLSSIGNIGLDSSWFSFGDLNGLMNNPPQAVKESLNNGQDLNGLLNNMPPMVEQALNTDYSYGLF
ncbi:MAG: hypothetical protein AB1782_05070 [Cyanobacteriota bacterium]